MNDLHHLLRIKSRLVYMLLAVFVANIMAAGTGLSAPVNWLEHEKTHYVVADAQMDLYFPAPAPEESGSKKQNKHESHASHFFKVHVAVSAMPLPPAEPLRLTISHLSSVFREFAEPPFRPPQ